MGSMRVVCSVRLENWKAAQGGLFPSPFPSPGCPYLNIQHHFTSASTSFVSFDPSPIPFLTFLKPSLLRVDRIFRVNRHMAPFEYFEYCHPSAIFDLGNRSSTSHHTGLYRGLADGRCKKVALTSLRFSRGQKKEMDGSRLRRGSILLCRLRSLRSNEDPLIIPHPTKFFRLYFSQSSLYHSGFRKNDLMSIQQTNALYPQNKQLIVQDEPAKSLSVQEASQVVCLALHPPVLTCIHVPSRSISFIGLMV